MKVFQHVRPFGLLSRIGQKILDDCRFADDFPDIFEQRFPFHPSVSHCIRPALSALPLTNDDVDPVVAQVQRLGRPLHAVAEDGDRLALQHLARLRHREFLSRNDLFLRSAKINDCHNYINLMFVFLSC